MYALKRIPGLTSTRMHVCYYYILFAINFLPDLSSRNISLAQLTIRRRNNGMCTCNLLPSCDRNLIANSIRSYTSTQSSTPNPSCHDAFAIQTC